MISCQSDSSIGHRTKFRRLRCWWVTDRCTSIIGLLLSVYTLHFFTWVCILAGIEYTVVQIMSYSHRWDRVNGSEYWGLFKNQRDSSFYSALFPPILVLSLLNSTTFSKSHCPFPQRSGCWPRKIQAESAVGWQSATAQRHHPRVLAAQVSGHSPALVSMQCYDLQNLLSFPRSFLQLGSSKPSFRILQPLDFPIYIVNVQKQMHDKLLIVGSVSHLFINWRNQDMPQLLTSSVIKIYSQPIPVAASRWEVHARFWVQKFSFR